MIQNTSIISLSKLIGYAIIGDGSYKSLHEVRSDTVNLDEEIVCLECNKVISDSTGPKYNAICLNCFRAKKQGIKNV